MYMTMCMRLSLINHILATLCICRQKICTESIKSARVHTHALGEESNKVTGHENTWRSKKESLCTLAKQLPFRTTPKQKRIRHTLRHDMDQSSIHQNTKKGIYQMNTNTGIH